ncbi:hypothetical protein FHG64_12745 [Antarcticibacterium flavum]|uniref:DUF4878 domain-containing protein n=1 Tax=Antarcticibacterium flavum TaxID=2058175 RepID=A0A5B7X646_9FLAO|nr:MULTISPECIES: hypothetical protein [Antarcticibacterium]MCM4158446.1 hypothetical protein [Antarcticibacterium sp. W02-3]QCY70202.1 hypothetical protein FHG64_12745 [Antarcticibacterium flavum]
MKRILLYSFLLALVGCNEKKMSHTETAKAVAESFYQGDKEKLEKHTTAETYANFMTIQNLYSEDSEANFNVIQEQSDGQTAWVKFTTSFTDEPEIFKLIMEDGRWKVAERDEGEKIPF